MTRLVTIALCLILLGLAVWMLRGGPGGVEEARRATSDVTNADVGRDRPAAPGGMGAPMPGAPDAGGRAEVLQPRPLPTPVPGRGGPGPGDAPDDDDLELLIRTAMEHPDPLERAAAISDLALEDDLEVVAPVLQHASADEHQDVKLAVVMALSQFGEAVPLDLLNQYANDPDPEVRLEVLDLVADLSEEDGIPGVAKPILDRAMRDPDEEVRSRAAEIQDYLNEVAGESDSDLE
jgi:hypothetical protein